MDLLRAVLVVICVSRSSPVRILPSTCPRQDLNCTVSSSTCMDKTFLKSYEYTPSGPEELTVSVDIRDDGAKRLQPFLNASWKIKDDGSIGYLEATELHVLVKSTNENLCVRYSFKDKLSMRSPSGEKWMFSANMVVLDPAHEYQVSVFNIPKPEIEHTVYNVNKNVLVPGCQDPKMQKTQYCSETGSLWKPNISLAVSGKSALAVSFNPDGLCEKYIVIVGCSSSKKVADLNKDNQTTLNVMFSLDDWPRSCCQFDVEINPLFPKCANDCTRRMITQNICVTDTEAPEVRPYTLVSLGVVFISAMIAVLLCMFCRKLGKTDAKPPDDSYKKLQEQQQPLKQAPKVLVIYSQDHPLYRNIVLKLCAFLQAKCGTKVVVDMLDSTSVSMVGRLRWLECQRQQLNSPSDKILVLCSRGVQAKWRALCGQGRVTLREDILSPTDDMLTPFLNLFLPDMHQAGMLGKYMVAYFDGISTEQDVPSVFDIAVKYNLMKHFEDMYFRILDMEKYQPGQVNHIEGIGGDDYFNCPSGKALRNAIETFQAYQLESPDWFEKQCLDSEEEIMNESSLLIDQLQIPPVLEFVPLIRDGPPSYIQEVEINENNNSVQILTPEMEPQLSSVAELKLVVNPESRHQHPPSMYKEFMDLHNPYSEAAHIVDPLVNTPQIPSRPLWISLEEQSPCQIPTEDDEDSLLHGRSKPSTDSDQSRLDLQNSLDSNPLESCCAGIQSEYSPSSETCHSHPVEMEEDMGLEHSRHNPSSGSDQGYISKLSSQHEPPFKEDPLEALARLQETLFQQNLRYSDTGPELN
ncbi:interleukin 17 receptor A1a [Mugil cephalus]|uniref:interleukin 17 receptor A1a n=1 Tax=Mugil cephalus TaxID=48193 RepID=UPI001FB6F342|nr:interleukin 17 receptor A1a [Mugil cephalus]